MCFYIGIEDLAANALIEILKTKEEKDNLNKYKVTLAELEKYGAEVIQYLDKQGEKAVLVLSRESTNMMFKNYSDFFDEIEENGEIKIALKEGKTVLDLVEKFRSYLAFDVMMAFMSEYTVQVLQTNNG